MGRFLFVAAAMTAALAPAHAFSQERFDDDATMFQVAPLPDPELSMITGMALEPSSRLRTLADVNAAMSASQMNTISRTIFDNWFVDVAAPLIISNQLALR